MCAKVIDTLLFEEDLPYTLTCPSTNRSTYRHGHTIPFIVLLAVGSEVKVLEPDYPMPFEKGKARWDDWFRGNECE